MPPKYKNLTNDERKAVLWFLQARAKEENKNGLQRGAIAEAATHFNKKHVTIQRIWNRAKKSKEAGDVVPNVDSRKAGNVGCKPIDRTNALEAMRRVPMRRRQTIRSLACAISVPKSSVFRILKDQKIKRVSSTVKPCQLRI